MRWLALLLIACNGSSDGVATCNDACGGDPTGDWTASSECGGAAARGPICGGTVDYTGIKFVGTLSFSSDKTFRANVSLKGNAVFTTPLPATCNGSTESDCPTICNLVMPASASVMGQSCECTQPADDLLNDGMGTWETVGNTLNVTFSGGSVGHLSFCERGNTLSIMAGSSLSGLYRK